jgi:hypothetical protein
MSYRSDGTAQQQQHCGAITTAHPPQRAKKLEFPMKFDSRKLT